MRFRFATESAVGPRSVNEDSVGVWPIGNEQIAVAVADGLGGYNGGRKASELAISMFGHALEQRSDIDLHVLALAINEEIRKEQRIDPSFRGMATTLSGAVIVDGMINFVHCGDTRIALQRRHGIRRLTTDHTEARRLLDEGIITRDEYFSYPRKNIIESALGASQHPRIDVGVHEVLPGDRLYITSDGVHNKVFLKEICAISIDANEPSEAISKIFERVIERGPEDNFTVAAIFFD